MNKLGGGAQLPVYSQNTLFVFILFMTQGFCNFKTFKNWLLIPIVIRIIQCCVLYTYFSLTTTIHFAHCM